MVAQSRHPYTIGRANAVSIRQRSSRWLARLFRLAYPQRIEKPYSMGIGTLATGCSSSNVTLFAAMRHRKFQAFLQDEAPRCKRAKNVSFR
ncbi:hypothetical protein [Caballeronia sordidicola]|nr:hypothetical protein [Caballeronia sordidicola]